METASLSTDQVAAFVELARGGSLRAAAEQLHLTEQGIRSRLLVLESRLGVELYRKARGPRRGSPLTDSGRRFLPHAIAFLERAEDLCHLFSELPRVQHVHVVASQYLLAYLLIDVVTRFHALHPDVRIRLGTRSERELEQELLTDPDISLGIAAPYESTPQLEYQHLFSMEWQAVMRPRHRLSRQKSVSLALLAEEPLILYEQGSTGREHVLAAFAEQALSPRVEMETTNTDVILRMVEGGLGVSLVPLMASGEVTRGRRVTVRPLRDSVRPIRSGILRRRGDTLSEPAERFREFVVDHVQQQSGG